MGQSYECLFLGRVSKEHDHILTMLRTARLLQATNFNTDKEAVLEAIHQLNEQADNKLIHFAECRTIRAITAEDFAKANIAWQPYCEDERLSIGNGGELFKALYLPPDTPTIDPERLDRLLEILAMYFDWAGVKPKSRGEAYRAWKKIDDALSPVVAG